MRDEAGTGFPLAHPKLETEFYKHLSQIMIGSFQEAKEPVLTFAAINGY